MLRNMSFFYTRMLDLVIALCLFDSVARAAPEAGNALRYVRPSMYDTKSDTLPELRSRDVTTVDLNAIPLGHCDLGALFTDCSEQPPSSVPSCPLVPAPCPDSGNSDCKSYTLDCFCNAATPLSCAWSCSWEGWMYVEDWFTKMCPETKPVDFDPLPSCARDCISDGSFNYGCITQSRSCFCIHGELNDCPDKCTKEEDIRKIEDSYASECKVSHDDAVEVAGASATALPSSGENKKEGAVVRQSKGKKLHWYEILVIFTAALTVFVAILWSLVLN